MTDAKDTPTTPDDPESLDPAAQLGEPISLGADEEQHDVTELPEHEAAAELARSLLVTARNNPNPPTQADLGKVSILTELSLELGTAINFLCPDTRDRSLALTALEDVLTRASKSIYVKQPFGGSRAPALYDQAQARLQAEAAE